MLNNVNNVNGLPGTSDGKFGSFYWLGPLSFIQQNEQIFFRDYNGIRNRKKIWIVYLGL